MEFKQFNEKLMAHVAIITKGMPHLFETEVSKDEMWEMYLESFPPGTNGIFRERREFDCNCCKHFIRVLGNVVVLKNGLLTSIWDFDAGDETFQVVIDAMAELVKSHPIRNVFLSQTRKVGTRKNYDTNPDCSGIIWYHFHAVLDKAVRVFRPDEVGTESGRFRDSKNVLMRSLIEFTGDSIETLLDLIAQKSLYKGEEWDRPLVEFKKLFDAFWKLEGDTAQDLFCWEMSTKVGSVISRIRNHSIGVLLQDLSGGRDLNEAVRRYEKIVAPSNYKRPKAIFTKAMVKRAQQTVVELGFQNSLGRRHAVLDDITVPNVLFANRDAAKVMSGDPFDELADLVPVKLKTFDRAEEVPADKFVSDILSTAREIEVLLESNHGGNMVSLIAPKDREAPSMFKWKNGFSWAYAGNITDSMKERVKALGGNVEAELRFSIQWNENRDNNDDLDAHAIEPRGREIYFQNKGRRHPSSGMLDVDIVNPERQAKDGPAVENITWIHRNKMPRGTYKLFVNNYSARGAKSGFSAEVEFDGQIHSFAYPQPLKNKERVPVAEVTFDGKNFIIKKCLPSQMSSRDIWGLLTNSFHPVSVMMYSPNYWNGQSGIGHRHYFFMLKGCMNPESPNGFFNEFLPERLMEHKRVFEALGSKMRVENTEQQLSGVGFSSTKRASVIVKVKGSFERLIKVVF
jgi:hypothetical protein